jgi:hypothetical protein
MTLPRRGRAAGRSPECTATGQAAANAVPFLGAGRGYGFRAPRGGRHRAGYFGPTRWLGPE